MNRKATATLTRLGDAWPALKGQIRRLGLFASIFLLGKISGFVSALWLSQLVTDMASYGLFEYALSVGILIAIALNVGLQAAYPYFNLKKRERGFRSIFYFHPLLCSGLIGGILLMDYWLFQVIEPKLQLALLIGGIIAMQLLLSYILKSHEFIIRAVLLDGGLFIAINFYNLFVWLSGKPYDFETLKSLLLCYFAGLLVICFFHYWKNRQDFSWKRYLEAISFGKHLVLSSTIVIVLTNGARIFIEYFLGLEQVASYSFYFRFAVVVILIQQVFNIAFFKKIYRSKAAQLDNFFSAFIIGALFVAMLFWLLLPNLLSGMFSFFEEGHQGYAPLYFILSFHALFWISISFNENIIYRENLSRQMNRAFVLLLVGMLAIFTLLHLCAWLTLFSFAIVNLFFLFWATDIQFSLLLKHRRLSFRHSRLLNRGMLLLFAISYLLIF